MPDPVKVFTNITEDSTNLFALVKYVQNVLYNSTSWFTGISSAVNPD